MSERRWNERSDAVVADRVDVDAKMRDWCVARLRERRAETMRAKRRTSEQTARDMIVEELQQAACQEASQGRDWDEAIANMSQQDYLDLMIAVETSLYEGDAELEGWLPAWEHESTVADAGGVQVLCPLCKQAYLAQDTHRIFCRCGLQMHVMHEGLSLQHVKDRLACLWETHGNSGCRETPTFVVFGQGQDQVLYLQCGHCRYVEVVL